MNKIITQSSDNDFGMSARLLVTGDASCAMESHSKNADQQRLKVERHGEPPLGCCSNDQTNDARFSKYQQQIDQSPKSSKLNTYCTAQGSSSIVSMATGSNCIIGVPLEVDVDTSVDAVRQTNNSHNRRLGFHTSRASQLVRNDQRPQHRRRTVSTAVGLQTDQSLYSLEPSEKAATPSFRRGLSVLSDSEGQQHILDASRVIKPKAILRPDSIPTPKHNTPAAETIKRSPEPVFVPPTSNPPQPQETTIPTNISCQSQITRNSINGSRQPLSSEELEALQIKLAVRLSREEERLSQARRSTLRDTPEEKIVVQEGNDEIDEELRKAMELSRLEQKEFCDLDVAVHLSQEEYDFHQQRQGHTNLRSTEQENLMNIFEAAGQEEPPTPLTNSRESSYAPSPQQQFHASCPPLGASLDQWLSVAASFSEQALQAVNPNCQNDFELDLRRALSLSQQQQPETTSIPPPSPPEVARTAPSHRARDWSEYTNEATFCLATSCGHNDDLVTRPTRSQRRNGIVNLPLTEQEMDELEQEALNMALQLSVSTI